MRLTESYLALGMPREAERAAAVLGANYVGTEWYEHAYELMQKHPPKEVAAATPGQVLAPGAPGTGTTAEEAVFPDPTDAPDTTGAAPSAQAPAPPPPPTPRRAHTGRSRETRVGKRGDSTVSHRGCADP